VGKWERKEKENRGEKRFKIFFFPFFACARKKEHNAI
jgi:hypothetical protein